MATSRSTVSSHAHGGSSGPNRNVPSSARSTAKQMSIDAGEQRRAVVEGLARVARLRRAAAALDDVEDGRRVGRVEPERARLAGLREQPEQLRQCECFECSLQHDFPHRHGSLRASTGRAARLERADRVSPARRSAGAASDVRPAGRAGELGRGPHDRDGRVPARPALDLERGLVHEHAEAVDHGRAPVAGAAQQRGLERVVHEVGDDLARVQRVERQRERRSASGRACAMPIGVALTTSPRRRRDRRRVVPGDARTARESAAALARPRACGRRP